jgi:hypothetical protein
MSDFHYFLARHCAVNREKFGDGERSLGVRNHILRELDEIEAEATSEGRAGEWVDVVLLALDGHMRAVREMLREKGSPLGPFNEVGPTYDATGVVIAWNGEPTNDYVAGVAVSMIATKHGKHELRDYGDWRARSEDEAIEHKRGNHD